MSSWIHLEFISSKDSIDVLTCSKKNILTSDKLEDLNHSNMSSSRESSLEVAEIDKHLNSPHRDDVNLNNNLISKKKFKVSLLFNRMSFIFGAFLSLFDLPFINTILLPFLND